MSSLPAGWIEVPLQEVLTLRSDRVTPADEPGLPYLGLEQIEPHTNRILGSVPSSAVSSSALKFQVDDVLYGRMRPYLNKVVVPPFNGIASAEFLIFASNPHLISEFIKFRLSAPDFVEFSCAQISGDRPRVKFEQLGKFQLALPPYAEQKRIVAKLKNLLAGLDVGLLELRSAKAKSQQARKALFKSAVTGELSEIWRKKHLGAEINKGAEELERVLQIRRKAWDETQMRKFKSSGVKPPTGWEKKYPCPPAPDLEGLPKLPPQWVWASLGQLTEIQGGIQKKPSRIPTKNKYPFLRVANVGRDELRLEEVHEIELFEGELERNRLKPGDLLIVEGNGSLTEIGRCAVWRGELENVVHQNHLIRARPVECSSEYLATWINSPLGMDILAKLAATTSGLYTLSVGKIAKVPVPLPPLSEQLEIIKLLKKELASVQGLEEIADASLKQTEMQKKNLLISALSGQLVPQHEQDEPASVLLQKITASKANSTKKSDARKKPSGEPTVTTEKCMATLIEVLRAEGSWIAAQDAFRRCGVVDGVDTDRIEEIYAELRQLDKDNVIEVRRVGQVDEIRIVKDAEDATS